MWLTSDEWTALRKKMGVEPLTDTEREAKLMDTELWHQSATTWATVAVAQFVRSVLSGKVAGATLYVIPVEDHVLDRPHSTTLTSASLAEQLLRYPNVNNTACLPGIALLHIGMEVRTTVTVETPEAVVDSTGVVVGITLDPREQDGQRTTATVRVGKHVLRNLPLAVTVKLDEVTTEYLSLIPCAVHATLRLPIRMHPCAATFCLDGILY